MENYTDAIYDNGVYYLHLKLYIPSKYNISKLNGISISEYLLFHITFTSTTLIDPNVSCLC